jgi:FMN-dependent NADH-azoreductase
MLERTILFDLCHNEMLDIDDSDFTDFKSLLTRLNLKIKKNESDTISEKSLQSIDLIVIGNPIDNYFSNIEIKILLDFIRTGGSALIISEYGADYLQKTNLNDIIGTHLGIYLEKNLVKAYDTEEDKVTSQIHFHEFNGILSNLREIVIGGTCSVFVNKDAVPMLKTSEKGFWSEVYNNSKEEWVKEKEQAQIIMARVEFGKGKLIVIGDIDIFTNNPTIGITAFDNSQFIQTIIDWLLSPVEETNVITFLLKTIGDIQNDMKDMNNVLNNIIETMGILEKRISHLERNIDLSLNPEKRDHRLDTETFE